MKGILNVTVSVTAWTRSLDSGQTSVRSIRWQSEHASEPLQSEQDAAAGSGEGDVPQTCWSRPWRAQFCGECISVSCVALCSVQRNIAIFNNQSGPEL
jgi:hypothetical protein